MAKVQKGRRSRLGQITLEPNQAIIAVLIGAMNANRHVAPDEAGRAHHLIWSTRRFRRKSGATVGKLIEDMRTLLEERDADTVMEVAAKAIPARLRPSVFAVLVDLLFADGKMDAQERRFLQSIGSRLKLEPETVRQIVAVVLLKNQL